MLSIGELMRSRVKMIAAYPSTPYKVGDIIDFKEEAPFHPIHIHDAGQYGIDTFLQYPHLFQLAHWAENRTQEEFPAYVCSEASFRQAFILKVLAVHVDARGFVHMIETDSADKGKYFVKIFSRPATQEEYEASKQNS